MIIRYAVKSPQFEQELLTGQTKGPVFVCEQAIKNEVDKLVGDWYVKVWVLEAEHSEFLVYEHPKVVIA